MAVISSGEHSMHREIATFRVTLPHDLEYQSQCIYSIGMREAAILVRGVLAMTLHATVSDIESGVNEEAGV